MNMVSSVICCLMKEMLAEHRAVTVRISNDSCILNNATCLEVCICRVAMRAIVDDPVHIKVQIICIQLGTQFKTSFRSRSASSHDYEADHTPNTGI